MNRIEEATEFVITKASLTPTNTHTHNTSIKHAHNIPLKQSQGV